MLNCGEHEVKATRWLTAEQIIVAYAETISRISFHRYHSLRYVIKPVCEDNSFNWDDTNPTNR
jgi:hypothetical protein